MSASTDKEVARIADQIERYLEEHTHAADTIDGIARWWLPRQKQHDAKKVILVALELLVSKGVLVKDRSTDGSFIFQIAENGKTDCP